MESGLFRIRSVGSDPTDPVGPPTEDSKAYQARRLRHRLEQFPGRNDPRSISQAWPHLGSQDRAIRYAARVTVEHQDLTH